MHNLCESPTHKHVTYFHNNVNGYVDYTDLSTFALLNDLVQYNDQSVPGSYQCKQTRIVMCMITEEEAELTVRDGKEHSPSKF